MRKTSTGLVLTAAAGMGLGAAPASDFSHRSGWSASTCPRRRSSTGERRPCACSKRRAWPTTRKPWPWCPGRASGTAVIEVEIAGAPRAGTEGGGARGFVGVAFRLQKDPLRYECFYLRPTNGRAEDQLRRNHSTQYVSHPDHPWHRLRKESPGVYESYVDLVPGDWNRVRIVVSGTEARLFVNGAEQPVLIVKDLKLGASEGGVALWIGPGTEAHFAGLRVEPR